MNLMNFLQSLSEKLWLLNLENVALSVILGIIFVAILMHSTIRFIKCLTMLKYYYMSAVTSLVTLSLFAATLVLDYKGGISPMWYIICVAAWFVTFFAVIIDDANKEYHIQKQSRRTKWLKNKRKRKKKKWKKK